MKWQKSRQSARGGRVSTHPSGRALAPALPISPAGRWGVEAKDTDQGQRPWACVLALPLSHCGPQARRGPSPSLICHACIKQKLGDDDPRSLPHNSDLRTCWGPPHFPQALFPQTPPRPAWGARGQSKGLLVVCGSFPDPGHTHHCFFRPAQRSMKGTEGRSEQQSLGASKLF